jgi:hypothetical protein
VERHASPVRCARAASFALVLLAPTCAALAQETADGFILGRWILAPWMGARYGVDSNVFREVEGQEEEDTITGWGGGLEALLPFRKSMLRLNYEATDLEYAENVFDRTLAQKIGADLELSFRSGDVLALRESYTQDFARIEEQVEDVFTGQPYNINQWEVELRRELPQQQGYRMRVRRRDLIYEDTLTTGFAFEYRGFDNSFEYYQPLGERSKGVAQYRMRRFNHYDPTDPDAVGTAFRKEETDSLLVGLQGQLGDQQPYQVRLGYASFKYKGVDSEDFTGIVGALNWRIVLGGRTDLRLSLTREPLPSNFDTFYINNELRSLLTRQWRRFEGGADLRANLYTYGDEDLTVGCTGTRQDTSYDAGLFWEWKIHPRFSFDVEGHHYDRSSNCDGFDYTATSLETGFSLGWF